MARPRPGLKLPTPYGFAYEYGDVLEFVSRRSPRFRLRRGTFWQDSLTIRWIRVETRLSRRSQQSPVKQFCVEDVLVQRVLRKGVVVAEAAGYKEVL